MVVFARYANSVAPQLSFVVIFAHAGSENDHAIAEVPPARMRFAALSTPRARRRTPLDTVTRPEK
jgi:hypothetical protein